ncbi:MAG: hypothetical protein J5809_00590 [Selenomonadaceae bacterium]|nr:hypothetical protein [Selenomonadaceae bacterium]
MTNLQRKNYNPCGDATGSAHKICDAATSAYFNLPYREIMRVLVVQEISATQQINPAVLSWANYNLNDIEISAALDFTNFTPEQIGLSKFLLHLLYENRYNIEYNCLAAYAENLDAKILANVPPEILERKINSIAQETGYGATFDDMTAELENFVRSFGG